MTAPYAPLPWAAQPLNNSDPLCTCCKGTGLEPGEDDAPCFTCHGMGWYVPPDPILPAVIAEERAQLELEEANSTAPAKMRGLAGG